MFAVMALGLGLLAPGVGSAADNDRSPRPESSAQAGGEPNADREPDDEVGATDTDESDLPAPPVPAVPEGLPAAVDALPNYQGQGICDPAPKKGTQAFADLIKATYGSLATSVWIPRDCSIGGRSEHKEGRALDWMINRRVKVERKAAEAFLDWLLAPDANGNSFAMARRLGVMYIGWDDRIWESYTQRWSELKGCYSTPEPGSDNYCHRNHIHISLSWDGAAGQTSFWGGSPTPAPMCDRYASASRTALRVPGGLDFVATKSRRIVDTRTGQGVASGAPCRLAQLSSGGAGAPLLVRVRDIPGVPKSGVAALAVRTITVGSNSPAQLRAYTYANSIIAPVKPNGRTEAVTIVPVADDGSIGFTTDSGATHLIVDVLGYFVDPAEAGDRGGAFAIGSGVIAYDSADDTVLGPGEKRIIALGDDTTSLSGALIAVTLFDAEANGKLVIREAGSKRTPGTPVLSYRRGDSSTHTILTEVDDEGRIVVVNRGGGALSLSVAVQAASISGSADGARLVPVEPTAVDGRRTVLRRALRDARGSKAVVLQVDVRNTGKQGTALFWSGTNAPTTLALGRKSSQSSLVVVPLSSSDIVMREVVGDSVDLTARIVAYLR